MTLVFLFFFFKKKTPNIVDIEEILAVLGGEVPSFPCILSCQDSVGGAGRKQDA